jgi:hypothetical protein
MDRLEKENHRLKRIGALMAVGIAAVVLMGQANSEKVAKVIKAERFLLVDKDTGAPSAALEKIGGSAGLFLYDGFTGKKRAEMTVAFGVAPKIQLYESRYGKEDEVLASLTTALGVGELKLFDPETSHQISLGRDLLIYPDETELNKKLRMGMGLIIYKKDFPRAKLSSFPEGSFLSLVGERNIRARLWLDSDGPNLSLYDKKGNIRATLGSTSLETIRTGTATKTAESSLVLFDKKGKVLWSAP